ncbi:hypothetical protein [Escherichia coli]|uniref:hypothetical protein n=1 Tax=Escherichia coli TaxID=562 RepID=UPI0010D7178E|nr:hypothetical protein [Escherichia coli]GDM23868.1 hypothetical protein BvCmsNSNP012_04865 [Escherichia coli]
MKKIILLIALIVFLLEACNNQDSKVKKLLKCGISVEQLGNQKAKDNFKKYGVTSIFGNSPPNISSYDMMRLGEEARDELWMYGGNTRGQMERLIETYEEDYCVNIHKVPNDKEIENMKRLLKIL